MGHVDREQLRQMKISYTDLAGEDARAQYPGWDRIGWISTPASFPWPGAALVKGQRQRRVTACGLVSTAGRSRNDAGFRL